MDLRDYLRLLRRHWRVVVVATVLGALVGGVGAQLQPETYTAELQLYVAAQDGASGNVSNAYTGGLLTQQRVTSYSRILSSPRTGQLIVDALDLHRSASSVAKQVSATAPLNTSLLNVTVKDHDARTAQRMAEAIGSQFPLFVEQLEQPTSGGTAPIVVRVIQPPQLPTVPTTPRPKLYLGLGLVAGLLLGVGGAVLRESLDHSVKTRQDVETLTGSHLLGVVGFDPEARKAPLMRTRSQRAEAFRQIRTSLQFIDVEQPLRSVVISSSLAKEGKSTTACNLALAIAETGARVILVDADLRRPQIAEYMGLEGSAGLTSVLLGRARVADVLQPVGEGKLEVLTSGPLPPNPSELLGSSSMRELLRSLEARADIVILDAPPLLPVTDASLLGTAASGVLLVVGSNRTRRAQLSAASASLTGVGVRVVGVVLNMVPTRGPDANEYSAAYGSDYLAAPAGPDEPVPAALRGSWAAGRNVPGPPPAPRRKAVARSSSLPPDESA